MRYYPDAVNTFLSDPASNVRTEASRKSYRRTLEGLHNHYPDKRSIREFTEPDLVSFVNRPELSPNSRKSYRVRLMSFFDWATWRGHIPTNPAQNLKRLVPGGTNPVQEAVWLDSHEIEEMLQAIPVETTLQMRDLIIARLGFTMGLRRMEIAGLRFRQCDLRREAVHFMGKGRKQATVWTPPKTLEVLTKWRAVAEEQLGRPPVDEFVVPAFNRYADFGAGCYVTEIEWEKGISPDHVGKIFRRIAHQAGWKMSAHDMRRSYANALEEQGYSIEEISKALRHSNLGVTQRYLEGRQDAAYQTVKSRGFDL